MQMKLKAPSRNNCSCSLKCKFTKYKIKRVCLNQSSSLIVDSFSNNKKLKKLYPDMKFISHFIRNTSRPEIEIAVSYMRDTTVHRLLGNR